MESNVDIKKPKENLFIFDDELYFGQDEARETVDGYLWAIDGLVERMKDEVKEKHSSDIMEPFDNINFYPIYNLRTHTVKIEGTYYYDNGSGEEQGEFEIPLSEEERAALIVAMEAYCQKLHGKSCTEVLNGIRTEESLAPLPSSPNIRVGNETPKENTRKIELNSEARKYSVAQLKRDAKEGLVSAVMTMRDGEAVKQSTLPERLRGSRKIIASNSNSILFENKADPSKPSCVWLPKASLIEYTENYLRIYAPGFRSPTEEEQNVLKKWENIAKTEQYQKQLRVDCLTDGTTTYYQRLNFFREHNMEYLMGKKERGLCIDYNRRSTGEEAFIQDDGIKGKVLLEYQIDRTRTLEKIPLNKQIEDATAHKNSRLTISDQANAPARRENAPFLPFN